MRAFEVSETLKRLERQREIQGPIQIPNQKPRPRSDRKSKDPMKTLRQAISHSLWRNWWRKASGTKLEPGTIESAVERAKRSAVAACCFTWLLIGRWNGAAASKIQSTIASKVPQQKSHTKFKDYTKSLCRAIPPARWTKYPQRGMGGRLEPATTASAVERANRSAVAACCFVCLWVPRSNVGAAPKIQSKIPPKVSAKISRGIQRLYENTVPIDS